MAWLRWMFFLICAWSVTSAWAEDKNAPAGSSRYNLYLICLGVIAILAIVFEVRDIYRARARERR
jgi:hypothetical protein